MIQARELRVGNIFYDKKQKEYTEVGTINRYSADIELHDAKLGYAYSGSLDDLEPVKLTEDLLARAGFEKANDTDSWYKIQILNEWSFLFVNLKHKMFEISISKHACVLKTYGHLHQLQNLYYALTGQELTFTPSNPQIETLPQ